MKWSNLPRLEERNNDFAVSYSSRDRGEIAPILEGMRARGYRVFEYVDDLARAWGTKLGKRLDEVFSGSAALYVLFLSPHYWAGHWTRYEFEKIALTSSRGTNQDIVAFLLGEAKAPEANSRCVVRRLGEHRSKRSAISSHASLRPSRRCQAQRRDQKRTSSQARPYAQLTSRCFVSRLTRGGTRAESRQSSYAFPHHFPTLSCSSSDIWIPALSTLLETA